MYLLDTDWVIQALASRLSVSGASLPSAVLSGFG
jgi:hypothetical protein